MSKKPAKYVRSLDDGATYEWGIVEQEHGKKDKMVKLGEERDFLAACRLAGVTPPKRMKAPSRRP